LPSHASDRCRSWSVTPGVRLAVTLAYSARHDGGGSRALNPHPRPRPHAPAPAPAPDSAARRCPLGDPTARWTARFQAVPARVPPDWDDGAPGWGRLSPASGGVDHQPCIRPPWLSMNGTVWGGGEGGATSGGGEGCGGGGCPGGREASLCSPPPCPCRGAAILAEGVRELHRKRRTTNKRQSKVDEGCLLTRGSQFRAPTTPLPKDTICRWDWGEGVAGFNLAQKGRAGDEIIMRWMMTTTTMARGGSKEKVFMIVCQSLSA